MKIKSLAFLVFAFLFLFACKDDDDSNTPLPPEISVNDYFPLKVGNYWIFDVYKIDTLGAEEQLAHVDTIRIIGQTEIDGITFYETEYDEWLTSQNLKQTEFLRDSSGYLINSHGKFFLAVNGDNSILQTVEYDNTPFVSEHKMAEVPSTYMVPAGTFDCIDYQGRVFSSSSTEPFENYPERTLHNCYSEDVGPVFQTIFYAMGLEFHFERRLREYHLE